MGYIVCRLIHASIEVFDLRYLRSTWYYIEYELSSDSQAEYTDIDDGYEY